MTKRTLSDARLGATLPGVAALLFLLAAAGMVGIPHVLSARILSNERHAVALLRRIAAAEKLFSEAHPQQGFGALEEVLELAQEERRLPGGPAPSLDRPHLQDGILSVLGYRFIVYTSGPDEIPSHLPRRGPKTPRDRYVAFAWPARAGSSGNAIFGMDARGEVYLCENPPPSFEDPGFIPPAGLLNAVLEGDLRPLRHPPRRWLLLRWRSLARP